MTSNHSIIDVEKENNEIKNVNITFNTLRTYTTLYHTYFLLYCKGHIQMTRDHTIIEVETENNGVKMSISHSIHLEFYYIKLHLLPIKL